MSGINRQAFNSSTFPPMKKIFAKGPGPLKSIKRIWRLNNFSCVQTESCGYRGKKFDTVVYIPAIDSIAGDVPPLYCISCFKRILINTFQVSKDSG